MGRHRTHVAGNRFGLCVILNEHDGKRAVAVANRFNPSPGCMGQYLFKPGTCPQPTGSCGIFISRLAKLVTDSDGWVDVKAPHRRMDDLPSTSKHTLLRQCR